MQIAIGIISFLFGTIIGSFLNVVVLRMNTGKTLKGRSMCFSCGKFLTWHELIPLVSFIHQRGKCRKCKSPISKQYPIVETITGIVFMSIVLRLWPIVESGYLPYFLVVAIFYLFVFSVWIAIGTYDKLHTIIPDRLVWGVNAVIFVSLFFISEDSISFHLPSASALFSGIVLSLPFAFLWFASKGKLMGLGDAKLMLGIGWLLGISFGLLALLFSFWLGAIVAILLMLRSPKKYKMGSAIPFGPFLLIGAFIAFAFKPFLIPVLIGMGIFV